MVKTFEILEHTADIGIKAYGKDISELFINAADGITAVILGRHPAGDPIKEKIILHAADAESLLVAWLNELIYKSLSERKYFTKFRMNRIEGNILDIEAEGVLYRGKPDDVREVKAATYSGLRIAGKSGGYEVKVILDV